MDVVRRMSAVRLNFPTAAVVTAVALLLAVLGSAWLALAVAVFVSVPSGRRLTTIVIVADEPLAMLPRLQLTVITLFALAERQLPCVVLSDASWTRAGRGSVTETVVAAEGPRLRTVRV